MYVTVKPDGRIALTVNKAEIGQGVTTATPRSSPRSSTSDRAHRLRVRRLVPAAIARQLLHAPHRRVDEHERGLSAASPRRRRRARDAGQRRRGAVEGSRRRVHAPTRATSSTIATNRRQGYGELTLARRAAAHPEQAELKAAKPVQGRSASTNMRVDARAKVTGTAQFGIDVVVPNMVHALVIHGPVYGAEPKAIRADAAARKHARRRRRLRDPTRRRGGRREVLAGARRSTRRSRSTGRRATIAGLDTEKLRLADASLRRTEDESALTEGNVSKAMERRDQARGDLRRAVPRARPDGAAELRPCAVKRRQGRGVGADARRRPSCKSTSRMRSASRGTTCSSTRRSSAAASGAGLVGDWAEQAALIAKQVKRPVQLIWSRESDMTQAFYRPQGTRAHPRCGQRRWHKASAFARPPHVAVDRARRRARSSAARCRASRGRAGRAGEHVERASSDRTPSPICSSPKGLANTPYRSPTCDMTYTPVKSKLPIASWRSVGNSVTGFLVEGFIDELARAAKARSLHVPPEHAEARLAAAARARPRRDAREVGRDEAAGSAAASPATSASRPRSPRSLMSRSSTVASRCAACVRSSIAASRSIPTSCGRRSRARSSSVSRPRSIRRSRSWTASSSRRTSTRSPATHARVAGDHRGDPRHRRRAHRHRRARAAADRARRRECRLRSHRCPPAAPAAPARLRRGEEEVMKRSAMGSVCDRRDRRDLRGRARDRRGIRGHESWSLGSRSRKEGVRHDRAGAAVAALHELPSRRRCAAPR